jgi:hypothetical protein
MHVGFFTDLHEATARCRAGVLAERRQSHLRSIAVPQAVHWNHCCSKSWRGNRRANSARLRFEKDHLEMTADEASGLIRDGRIIGARRP